MENSLCKTCDGIETCNKYCAMQAGVNLISFINGIDTIETQIGDLRPPAGREKQGSIVAGHIIEVSGSPTYILAGLSASIDVSGKFTSYNGMTPQSILKMYLEKINATPETKEASMKTFKKFNSNKILPIPIKPGAECMISFKESSGTEHKNIKTVVGSVRWSSDPQTGKLSCMIHCPIDKSLADNFSKCAKIPMSEYGTGIKLPQIEGTLNSDELDRDLIKMSPVGFIKPIVVQDDKVTLVVDNNHLYRVVEQMVFIIGTWENRKIKSVGTGIDNIKTTKAFKKIHKGINYIERHRRFIVPYGLFEENKIDLRR